MLSLGVEHGLEQRRREEHARDAMLGDELAQESRVVDDVVGDDVERHTCTETRTVMTKAAADTENMMSSKHSESICVKPSFHLSLIRAFE